MGEGYRLAAGPALSSVQPDFEAFVVALRPRLSGGLRWPRDETGGTSSESAERQTRKETPMFAGTPHLQVEANGVAQTLLFLLLVLTALGVIAHAAFI